MKRKIIILLFLLFIFSLLSGLAKPSLADDKRVNTEQIKVIDGLNESAFSANMRFDVKRKFSFLERWFGAGQDQAEMAGNAYPWFVQYVNPEKLPDKDVVHKWEGEITIGFDWPTYSLSCSEENFSTCRSPASTRNEDSEVGYNRLQTLAEEQIKILIPEISNLTGLPVRYIPPNTKENASRRYARIRIVPITTTGQNNFFKQAHLKPPANFRIYSRGFSETEDALQGVVPFTPEARSQVEGYLLPLPDNSLGMSVCKIVEGLPPSLTKSLVTECLIRSLGFPALLKQSPSALSNWNNGFDSTSMIYELDGPKALQVDELKTSARYAAQIEYTDGAPKSFSLLDKALIGSLYCNHVKSGMSRKELVAVITSNNCREK